MWTAPSCQGIGHVAGLVDALKAAGCERIFTETASGAQRDRPELARALDYMRKGDVLVVWKLDRLARSIKQLIETIELLDGEGIGFQSVTEAMDTTTPGGRLLSLRSSSAASSANLRRQVLPRRARRAGRVEQRESSTKSRSGKRVPSLQFRRAWRRALPRDSASLLPRFIGKFQKLAARTPETARHLPRARPSHPVHGRPSFLYGKDLRSVESRAARASVSVFYLRCGR